MDRVEQYLDQVCRSGWPAVVAAAHARKLREHLLDAVAEHKATGPEEAALERGAADFGGPEQVRSELRRRTTAPLPVVIDKAMQWKEKTMRAKWLWTMGLSGGGRDRVNLLLLSLTMLPKLQKSKRKSGCG